MNICACVCVCLYIWLITVIERMVYLHMHCSYLINLCPLYFSADSTSPVTDATWPYESFSILCTIRSIVSICINLYINLYTYIYCYERN